MTANEYMKKIKDNLDSVDSNLKKISVTPQEQTDTWSIKDVADTFKKHGLIVEQEPCEDAISRILKRMWNCRGEHTTSIDKVKMEQIIRDELPSVTPQEPKIVPIAEIKFDDDMLHEIVEEAVKNIEIEPKTGHWEWVQYDYNPKFGNWHCSECRCVVVECVGKEEKGGIPLYKYCPQCGAKMFEPQESEDKE